MKGSFEDALDCYRDLLVRYPAYKNRSAVLMETAECHIGLKKYAEALKKHHIDVEKWIFLEDAKAD